MQRFDVLQFMTEPDSVLRVFYVQLANLICAALAGAVIGWERERSGKPAGLRTNTLIALGAALFTLVAIDLGGQPADASRIVAQIVTGVGFLGAGAIIQSGGSVHGLTTAATIWTVAGVGMAFGAGRFSIGVTATALVLLTLMGLSWAEAHMARRSAVLHARLSLDGAPGVLEAIESLTRRPPLRRGTWLVRCGAQTLECDLEVWAAPAMLARLIDVLQKHPGVRSVNPL
jgi:putative Mg2+ transporter-C (MgtC) family protein